SYLACTHCYLTLPDTTSISTLSLHDALPILIKSEQSGHQERDVGNHVEKVGDRQERAGVRQPMVRRVLGNRLQKEGSDQASQGQDRKSTRLNSSHEWISYAVFCLKKKREKKT